MPGRRVIEEWIRADLKRIFAQPEELFIHALSPKVGVPDPCRDNDRDQDGGGDREIWLPPLGSDFTISWQRRDFRQHRQRASVDQVSFAADAIIHEFHADTEDRSEERRVATE